MDDGLAPRSLRRRLGGRLSRSKEERGGEQSGARAGQAGRRRGGSRAEQRGRREEELSAEAGRADCWGGGSRVERKGDRGAKQSISRIGDGGEDRRRRPTVKTGDGNGEAKSSGGELNSVSAEADSARRVGIDDYTDGNDIGAKAPRVAARLRQHSATRLQWPM